MRVPRTPVTGVVPLTGLIVNAVGHTAPRGRVPGGSTLGGVAEVDGLRPAHRAVGICTVGVGCPEVVAHFVAHELEVRCAGGSPRTEDLIEAHAVVAAAQPANPGNSRPAPSHLLPGEHHHEGLLDTAVVRAPVLGDLVELFEAGAPGCGREVRVRRRRQTQDRIALVHSNEEVTLVDGVDASRELRNVVRGVRGVVAELGAHELVVGVHRDHRGVQASQHLLAGCCQALGALLIALEIPRQSFVATPEAPLGSVLLQTSLPDEKVFGSFTVRREQVVVSQGRHGRTRDHSRVGIDDNENARRVVTSGAPPQEYESRTRDLDLPTRVDGHDPGVGRVDLVASHGHRLPHARGHGPIRDGHAPLGNQLEEGRRKPGVQGEPLHLAPAVGRVDDSARPRGRRHAGRDRKRLGPQQTSDQQLTPPGTAHRDHPRRSERLGCRSDAGRPRAGPASTLHSDGCNGGRPGKPSR